MEVEEQGSVYTPSTPMTTKQPSDDTSVVSTITYGSTSASKSFNKKTSSFTSISARKRMKHPPPDPNTTKVSLITDYASKKPAKAASNKGITWPRCAADYIPNPSWGLEFASPEPSKTSHTPSTTASVASYTPSYATQKNECDNDSVESNDLPCSVTCDPNNVKISPCYRCKDLFPQCCEVLFRNICLHAVMDYFDKVGVYHATELGVQKVFYAMYLAQVKLVI